MSSAHLSADVSRKYGDVVCYSRILIIPARMVHILTCFYSHFVSASTIFTIDIWKRVVRPRASTREMMIVGRIWVLVMVGLSIAWVSDLWHFSLQPIGLPMVRFAHLAIIPYNRRRVSINGRDPSCLFPTITLRSVFLNFLGLSLTVSIGLP